MTSKPTVYAIRAGCRYPSGATACDEGVNFSIYSRHAIGAEILLYQDSDSVEPFQVIRLDPEVNHTFFYWHVFVAGLPAGIHYTWRMDGPYEPKHGWRFDPEVELVDPWARIIDAGHWNRWTRQGDGLKAHNSLRGVVVSDSYDWQDDNPVRLPAEEMIIYEMHVGGFTKHPSSNVKHPGTFAGIIEKIPYLQALGITHVELMPVMAFDEQDMPDQVWDAGLGNYWGYSTHSFYAPHPGYCVTPNQDSQRDEFRDMVKALHRAGIGVILDVVFNHTAEGGGHGPAINFKGFGNETFYILDQLDKGIYLDFTGCGNTVNANHPFVARFIIHCLEYWVREMHVDGFRFDLASALARGEDGQPLPNPPQIWGIELSETLAPIKIIAEAWDAAGLYQVGSFPGYRWMEWNGLYRDTIRQFVRGDPGITDIVATRITGSSDLYQGNLRLPINSINFVTCHDGFTLWDLVSYNDKHNQANIEHNKDGCDHNLSWNCGVEGETREPDIIELRRRQAKNLLGILLLSQGIPMLLAGDEMLRSQGGNNNAWCQDNETSWMDWSWLGNNADHLRYVAEFIALRKRHPNLRQRRFLIGQPRGEAALPDIEWHGLGLRDPNWDDPDCRVLAFTLARVEEEEEDLHILLNMDVTPQTFALPDPPVGRWHLAVDTNHPAPDDIIRVADQRPLSDNHYCLGPRSLAVLEHR